MGDFRSQPSTASAETRTVHDPFLGKDVQVGDKLTDRLRGRYASGPHLPNGEPEFGWRQFQAPPIQHEAAQVIESLSISNATLKARVAELEGALREIECGDSAFSPQAIAHAVLQPKAEPHA